MKQSYQIAVLGTGAMGHRMAHNLLKAGHTLTVWNRSPEKAASLVEAGATLAGTPKEAASHADFVMSMVRDDDASREVWLHPETGALKGMPPGSIGVESSTLSPEWVKELGLHLADHGLALLEAPVSGSRAQADAATLVYLAGGETATLERATPILNAMGSIIQHVGPLGTGALVKLSTNMLLGIQVTTLAELIGTLKNAGADAEKAIEAISKTSCWSPVANYLSKTMLTGNFAPQFPIELIEKDFSYFLKVAGAEQAPTIAAGRHVFQQAIEKHLGEENMTGVVKLYTR